VSALERFENAISVVLSSEIIKSLWVAIIYDQTRKEGRFRIGKRQKVAAQNRSRSTGESIELTEVLPVREGWQVTALM